MPGFPDLYLFAGQGNIKEMDLPVARCDSAALGDEDRGVVKFLPGSRGLKDASQKNGRAVDAGGLLKPRDNFRGDLTRDKSKIAGRPPPVKCFGQGDKTGAPPHRGFYFFLNRGEIFSPVRSRIDLNACRPKHRIRISPGPERLPLAGSLVKTPANH